MGQIQSSVGLVTGVPIVETVDQLISISARPRDLLQSRTNLLQTEQVAITALTSLVLGLKFSSDKLGQELAALTRVSARYIFPISWERKKHGKFGTFVASMELLKLNKWV